MSNFCGRGRSRVAAVICLAICITGCEYGGPENPERFDDAVLRARGAWVVKVTVKSLVFTKGPRKVVDMATISIGQVLYGPPEIRGKTLDVRIYQQGNSGALEQFQPALKVGERGVWLVRFCSTDGRLEVDAYTMQGGCGFPLRLPARKSLSLSDYESAIEWGRDVAAVNAAAPGERKDLLLRLSGSNNDRTAAWAKASLGRLKEQERLKEEGEKMMKKKEASP